MLVHQILRLKPSGGVISVRPDASVSEAARVLAENRIGSVVVCEDGGPALGIFSERDIVRELAKSGGGCLARPVGDYMTRDVVTCSPDEKTEAVLEKMTERRFRHLPVVENGEMIGLISIGDVVKAQLTELAMEKDALAGMIMGH